MTRFSLFNRRFLLNGLIAFFMGLVIIGSSVSVGHAAQKKDKAVVFMEKVAKRLLAAVNSGSKPKLQRVIASYADLREIGIYSLGDHNKKLPRSRRTIYHRGIAKFMARYLMDQNKTYNVTGATIEGLGGFRQGYTLVDSKVIIEDGLTYDVQWRLKKYKNTYKIRDVKVLGFWLIPFQRDLFNNFVLEQGGNVNALVLALNH